MDLNITSTRPPAPCAQQHQLRLQVATSLIQAGIPITDDENDRGGAVLTPAADGISVQVAWRLHPDLYADTLRGGHVLDLLDLMDRAVADLLAILGWDIRLRDAAGATLVLGLTNHRHGRTS